jgi:hypothetical protein
MRTVPHFAGTFLHSLRRQRRMVEVSVRVGPHEVDALQVATPETLRAALRPIYAHLPAHEASVSYVAVEEDSLPLGIRRSRRTASLPGLRSAMSYLTGRYPIIIPAEASHWAHKVAVGAGSADRRD